MDKRKIVGDITLNLIASTLPIAVLQLLILPIVASMLGDLQYGLTVTIVSLFTLTSIPLGNVLNNIRLLQNLEYEKQGHEGDFNFLLVLFLTINTALTIVGILYYDRSASVLNITLVLLISWLSLMREYLIVSFRIRLNYKAILFNNIWMAAGYVVGLILFYLVGHWQLIFLTGGLSSFIYVSKNTTLIKESFSRTPLFKTTLHKSVMLYIASFTGTALSYADKLLLYPLLGPTAVAIYYSATIIGKMLSMVVTPISGVMLSYLARVESIKKDSFILLLLCTSAVGIAGYFICVIISKPLLNLLYPAWAAESLKLIYVTVATSVIGAINSVIKPLVLRFNSINWQVVLSIVNLIVYLLCASIFYKYYGLIGFCIGILISSIFSMILLIAIFLSNYQNVMEEA